MNQLIEKNSYAPNINFFILLFFVGHFWRQIFSRSTHRLTNNILSKRGTKTKVANFNLFVFVQQNVFGFDVSVDVFSLMNVLKPF